MTKDYKNFNEENVWYDKDVRTVFSAITSGDHGLTEEEAGYRLKLYGPNKLPDTKPPSSFIIFLKQFQSPLIYILLIAGIIVFFLGDLVDSLIIYFVLFANAFIGLLQEGKAHNILSKLKHFAKTEVSVIRDGRERIIDDSELVLGDIVLLREGNKIPGDGRIVDAHNLKIDESSLTGESEPVSKTTDVILKADVPTADQKNMVFKGTFAVTGTARVVITATGVNTVIGKISQKLLEIDSEMPLRGNIRRLSKIISIAVLAVSVVVFVVGLLYGNSIREMFFTSVAVAVSLIPEGLPIVITLVLATGVYRMAKQNALVKRLQAVEALGQATVIAVDKTGTITRNELMVVEIYVDGKKFEVSGNGYEPKGEVTFEGNTVDPLNHPELILSGKIASLCANGRVSFLEKEKIWKVSGDSTEAALFVLGEKIGFNKDDIEREFPQVFEIPFSSKTTYHATIHKTADKPLLTVVGAPETVISFSKSFWSGGKVKELTKNQLEIFESSVHEMSRKGLRVVAFAIYENSSLDIDIDALPPLTLAGLYGMRDVLREGVRDSIQIAKANGIKVAMITGDHMITAETIAREAGIFNEGDLIVTGKEIESMSLSDLESKIARTTVFSRVTPEHKLKIIEAYKKRGDIVAMTGDGVNDALSLSAADLGVAMGKSGTEVAKEASDIVLLDDNFKSILSAIEEGRSIYASIKKVILYLFSTGMGELFTIVGALLLTLPLPLLPVQILWLNLVTDGFLVLAIAIGPREGLDRKNHKTRNRFFLDHAMVWRMIMMALVMMIGTLFLFASSYAKDLALASTMALTSLAVFQWVNAWNVRSERESVFSKSIFSSKYLVFATIIIILLQIAAIYTPFMQKILHTVPLSLSQWGIIIAFSTSILLVEEIRKFIVRFVSRKSLQEAI